ncbi:hypothetical protein [Undibacterium sp. Ji22W]|uniref:hypothetical protein n=1 Tax=Undibacterium sp. Ji22W TaxID=3413038 RepID=UPI003BF5BE7E
MKEEQIATGANKNDVTLIFNRISTPEKIMADGEVLVDAPPIKFLPYHFDAYECIRVVRTNFLTQFNH